MVPITYNERGRGDARWHTIHSNHDGEEKTDAMNVFGSVVLRMTVEDYPLAGPRTVAVTSQVLPSCKVAQRWEVSLIEPDEDGEDPSILCLRVFEIVSNLTLREHQDAVREGKLILKTFAGTRFRYYDADDEMPRPPESLIRDVAEGLRGRPKTEVEALREDADRLQLELELAVAARDHARAQRDHLLGGLSWAEATADNPMPGEGVEDEDDEG